MLNEPVVQIAYFVQDIRHAAERMARLTGAGPFFVAEKIPLSWAEHRGRACDFVHSSAYGQWGEVMLEFVQQDSEGPSPFRDLYAEGEEGIHHMAMMVDFLPDTYRHYEDAGIAIATRAQTESGVEFAFIDTVVTFGHMLEVYERSEQLLGFYDMVRCAAQDWDGARPLRSLG